MRQEFGFGVVDGHAAGEVVVETGGVIERASADPDALRGGLPCGGQGGGEHEGTEAAAGEIGEESEVGDFDAAGGIGAEFEVACEGAVE